MASPEEVCSLPDAQRIRVMPSTLDTINSGRGVAATYPSENRYVSELLSVLTLKEVPLARESDIHLQHWDCACPSR